MIEFKEKKKVRKFLYSKPVFAILMFIFLLSLEGLWNMYGKYSEVSQKAQEAKIDLQKLRERKADLEKKVSFLKTERGEDEEIRKKFMVGKQGEGIILIVDQTASSASSVVMPTPSFWARFFNFF